jgi:hypothetical protein
LRCVVLGIAADPGRLYDGDDPLYELWLHGLCERVEAVKRDEAARQKAQAGQSG